MTSERSGAFESSVIGSAAPSWPNTLSANTDPAIHVPLINTHNGSPVPISPVWTAVTIGPARTISGYNANDSESGDRRARFQSTATTPTTGCENTRENIRESAPSREDLLTFCPGS
jgi:hypothetical protein